MSVSSSCTNYIARHFLGYENIERIEYWSLSSKLLQTSIHKGDLVRKIMLTQRS